MNEMEQKVLKTLSHQYKTQAAASTEIINLQSILNLPKGTEHFLTDIHGEYEQFNHVLKNGSGSVRRKIDEEFGNTISSKDKKSLATLIYYPESKLEIVEREEDNLEDWYKISLHRLVQVIKRVSSKYTRSKVRKALPKDFAYVIEELITEKEEIQDKEVITYEIITNSVPSALYKSGTPEMNDGPIQDVLVGIRLGFCEKDSKEVLPEKGSYSLQTLLERERIILPSFAWCKEPAPVSPDYSKEEPMQMIQATWKENDRRKKCIEALSGLFDIKEETHIQDM